jgi:putative membrane protein
VKYAHNRFIVRWAVNSLGLWIASRIISGIVIDQKLKTILWVGLLMSIINSILKPIIIILSLPALVFTLGIFMLVINGFMLLIVDKISSRLSISTFGAAVLGGIIIGLVNYLISTIIDQSAQPLPSKGNKA